MKTLKELMEFEAPTEEEIAASLTEGIFCLNSETWGVNESEIRFDKIKTALVDFLDLLSKQGTLKNLSRFEVKAFLDGFEASTLGMAKANALLDSSLDIVDDDNELKGSGRLTKDYIETKLNKRIKHYLKKNENFAGVCETEDVIEDIIYRTAIEAIKKDKSHTAYVTGETLSKLVDDCSKGRLSKASKQKVFDDVFNSDAYWDYANAAKNGVNESSSLQKYVVIKNRRGIKKETQPHTLSELISLFQDALEKGKSWENEKGKHKISLNPETIDQLVSNLNRAANNSALNGKADCDYGYEVCGRQDDVNEAFRKVQVSKDGTMKLTVPIEDDIELIVQTEMTDNGERYRISVIGFEKEGKEYKIPAGPSSIGTSKSIQEAEKIVEEFVESSKKELMNLFGAIMKNCLKEGLELNESVQRSGRIDVPFVKGIDAICQWEIGNTELSKNLDIANVAWIGFRSGEKDYFLKGEKGVDKYIIRAMFKNEGNVENEARKKIKEYMNQDSTNKESILDDFRNLAGLNESFEYSGWRRGLIYDPIPGGNGVEAIWQWEVGDPRNPDAAAVAFVGFEKDRKQYFISQKDPRSSLAYYVKYKFKKEGNLKDVKAEAEKLMRDHWKKPTTNIESYLNDYKNLAGLNEASGLASHKKSKELAYPIRGDVEAVGEFVVKNDWVTVVIYGFHDKILKARCAFIRLPHGESKVHSFKSTGSEEGDKQEAYEHFKEFVGMNKDNLLGIWKELTSGVDEDMPTTNLTSSGLAAATMDHGLPLFFFSRQPGPDKKKKNSYLNESERPNLFEAPLGNGIEARGQLILKGNGQANLCLCGFRNSKTGKRYGTSFVQIYSWSNARDIDDESIFNDADSRFKAFVKRNKSEILDLYKSTSLGLLESDERLNEGHVVSNVKEPLGNGVDLFARIEKEGDKYYVYADGFEKNGKNYKLTEKQSLTEGVRHLGYFYDVKDAEGYVKTYIKHNKDKLISQYKEVSGEANESEDVARLKIN